jgi:diguanylate cyclase (GGDEF)-like protein
MARKKNNDPGAREVGPLRQSLARLRRRIERLEREVVLAQRFAYHDSLTGLPNRSLMLDRLKQALSQATRQHKKVGVLLVDLDGFKQVNDELGHQAGDAILKSVAARLLSCIRVCDTACRYGGDEFVILLPEIESAGQLDRVKRKIHQDLCRPHRLGQQSIVVAGSIGSALFREDAESGAELIGVADAAMYRAKRASNGGRLDSLRPAARTVELPRQLVTARGAGEAGGRFPS